jgi:hypothetical protein
MTDVMQGVLDGTVSGVSTKRNFGLAAHGTDSESERRINLRHIGPDEQPHLIEGGYKGFNIVTYADIYYGVPLSHGPFHPSEIGTETYNRFPSASSPDAVRHQIDAVVRFPAAERKTRRFAARRFTPSQLLGAGSRLAGRVWRWGMSFADKAKSIVPRRG